MKRTRVKICGITRAEDAKAAIAAGADAIGLVFYAPSPRNVSLAQAVEIMQVVPPFVSVVGLFVDASVEKINTVLSAVPLDYLQFHGDEPHTFCTQFSVPYIKAIRVKSDTNLLQCAKDFFDAKALLLDTYTEGLVGGTGATFDWGLIPKEFPKPIILAGGLNAQNVQAAITQVTPFAVDVSGGVEHTKGIKDAQKITEFIQKVNDNCGAK